MLAREEKATTDCLSFAHTLTCSLLVLFSLVAVNTGITRIRLTPLFVTSIFLYVCESWTPTAELQRRILAMEMRVLPQDTTHLIQRPCYQRGSPCRDPAGNRTHEDLLTIAKRRKLQWYGYVSRSSGLVKTISQGTSKEGRRRQGRKKKKREDSNRELTGLEFAKSKRAVKNRDKWRKLVAKPSMAPQRPSQLRE